MNKTKVGILGTGAFGLAIAKTCYKNNCDLTLWTKFEEEQQEISNNHEYKKVLPGVKIEKEIKITTDLSETINNSEVIILAIPISFLSDVLKEVNKFNIKKKHFLITTKGIEQNTNLLVHELFQKHINCDNWAILSGPNFAIDLVKNNPIGMTLYASNTQTFNKCKTCLINKNITIERSDDVIGITLCGSIKNIIAIASGIINGLGFNESSNALFMTKAINDMQKLIVALGGNKETMYTLAGIGDLLLTCGSEKSRNYQFGYLLATNKTSAKEYLKTHTVEGYYTLKSIVSILEKNKKENTLIKIIKNIILKDVNPKTIINYLKMN